MKKQLAIIVAICSLFSCSRNEINEPRFTKVELDSIRLLKCDSLIINEVDSAKYSDLLPIPINLEECFSRLNKVITEERKEWIRCLTEEQFTGKMHLGFGMGLRNNWKLWTNSELAKYFFNIGVFHPDDMSGIILTSYYRKLNNQPIKLEEQVEYYQNYWTDLGENVDSILDLAKNEKTWTNRLNQQ